MIDEHSTAYLEWFFENFLGDCIPKFNMKFTHIVNALVIALTCHNDVHGQVTFLDKYRPEYRMFRNSVFNFVGRSDSDKSYNWNYKKGVRQNTESNFIARNLHWRHYPNFRKFKNHFRNLINFSVIRTDRGGVVIRYQKRCIN